MEVVAKPFDACDQVVAVYEGGEMTAVICPAEAVARGLTVVDLSSEWAPRVFDGDDEHGSVPFRERYLALARAELGDDASWDRARNDRFYELYGIFPTPELVASRLLDEERHLCHDEVPPLVLDDPERGIDTWRPLREQRGELQWSTSLRTQLQQAVARLGLASIDDLEGLPPHSARLRQYRRISARQAAISSAQAHFRCDGLLDDRVERDGLLDEETVSALQAYLRRHMVISWQIDSEAARIVNTDSRELDFQQLLRSLRERVAAAAGLIEDGSARGEQGLVVGRMLDTATFTHEIHEPLVDGAPDQIAAATDAAARALGWTSPEVTGRLLREQGLALHVALPLPPLPPYHAPHMQLRVEIDRGDVWYDFPFTGSGKRNQVPRQRLPSWVLYVSHGGRDIPLLRWPTTIGGWQPERLEHGRVKLVYKESPVGPRIIRDLVAAPRWVPPRSTPTRDLLRPRGHGVYVPRWELFGPDYASAYGMVMLIHLREDGMSEGVPLLTDQGVRSHGSVSYASILDGYSHGCHRLHNHRAVRLGDFLLDHRDHLVRGPLQLDFHRTLIWRRTRAQLHFDSRGYRYELTPPIDVTVLRGQVRGWAQRPLAPRSLTEPMLKRYD